MRHETAVPDPVDAERRSQPSRGESHNMSMPWRPLSESPRPRRGGPGSRGRGLGALIVSATLVVAAVVARPPGVRGQEQVRDFEKKAILVFNPGGHHAPVRALMFTPDSRQILSAGADKVVNVWDLKGARPVIGAVIRPPIWRGQAGSIYAMALAPLADEQGQRVLAVAGFGVLSRRGNVGLYRFPGANQVRTGDHFAELVGDHPDDPTSLGHGNVVTSLAFNPRGTLLASGSNDGTTRVWDVALRRTVAILATPGPRSAVNTVAFTANGDRVVAGGADGVLRLWDFRRPAAPVAQHARPPRNPADPLGAQINALAQSGDGRWVAIGREDGLVLRYDAASLDHETALSTADEAVESLAFNHDGSRLAKTSIARLRSRTELPRLACSVQVLSLPAGRAWREVLTLDNIAYASAFSPDGQTLAVAGGDRQALFLLRRLDAAPGEVVVSHGQGRSIWDVGLRVDQGDLAVGFSLAQDQNPHYPPPPAGRPNTAYRGFVLPRREIAEFDPAGLSRSILTYQGWTVRPVDLFHLEIVPANAAGRAFTVTLNPAVDRRWKCYSFIPPGPGHPRAVIAVGCESGVWFYRLDDGQPTRLFAGHFGPVYCLAPSSDGRWLATGSSDQTVRLWTLAGCDHLPDLGAEFEVRDGARVVKSVAPRSFAEAMDLRPGDRPREYKIAGQAVTEEEFFARYATLVPNTGLELRVRRPTAPPQPPGEEEVWLGTTERDAPALTLFLGEDNEWVVWMPSGYYDTSIAGDTRFLGWQFNRSPIPRPGPSDYLEIIRFENQLRQPKRSQPNKLDTLLRTADAGLALAVAFPPPPPPPPAPAAAPPPPPLALPPDVFVAQARPPEVTATIVPRPAQRVTDPDGRPLAARSNPPRTLIVEGPADGQKATVDLAYSIRAEGLRPARSLTVLLDGRPIRLVNQPAALGPETAVQVVLGPGTHRVVAEVANDLGIQRSLSTEILVRGPSRPRAARLKVLTIAPEFDERLIPQVKFAQEDADGLRKFFKKYMVSPETGTPLYLIDDDPLEGKLATAAKVTRAFESLGREPLEEGDLVVVVIESHLLHAGTRWQIAAADGRGVPPAPAIEAAGLARALGDVAKRKCKVLVFLDGVHTTSSQVWDTDVNEWVRHLRDEQNVITFIASNGAPSRHVTSEGHRAFAQAVLDSIKPPFLKDSPYTLNDLSDRVVSGTLSLTRRQQQPACYVPETLSGEFTLVNPRPEKP